MQWQIRSRRRWRHKQWRWRYNRSTHDKGSVRWKHWNRLVLKANRKIDLRTEQIHKANPVKARVALDTRWGGTQAIFEQVVHPFMRRHDLPIASLKRLYDTVDPGVSDHYVGCKKCYAADYGTYNGADIARALAKQLGIKGYRVGSYARHEVRFGGKDFSVQILWSVKGHYDHIHIGIRRA